MSEVKNNVKTNSQSDRSSLAEEVLKCTSDGIIKSTDQVRLSRLLHIGAV